MQSLLENGERDDSLLADILAQEHIRLVRLCANLTGNAEVAEDLAQETVLTAWDNREKIYDLQGVTYWLTATARNICLRWLRSNHRHNNHLTTTASNLIDEENASVDKSLEAAADPFDLEIILEQKELVVLLDRALALLPTETRTLLLQRYVEESSVSEIARKLGIEPAAATMRLRRGRLAFQRVLNQHLGSELSTYLRSYQRSNWQELPLWCFLCGERRLIGQYRVDERRLIWKCPTCCPDNNFTFGSVIDTSGAKYEPKDFQQFFYEMAENYYQEYSNVFTSHYLACPFCHTAMLLNMCIPEKVDQQEQKWVNWWYRLGHRFCYAYCSSCGIGQLYALENFVVTLPAVQLFYQKHPRSRLLPAREIEVDGQAAVVISFMSMDSHEQISVVITQDQLRVLAIHQA